MADRLLVSTKKGLFTFDRTAGGWRPGKTAFVGEVVSLTLPDPRDGGWYVAMNLGHFGTKLKYSPDGGQTWEDRASPAYPEGETFASFDGKPPAPATMKGFWALETVQVRRRRQVVGARARVVGPAAAVEVVRRRDRDSGPPFGPR
jgi:hypothetical protein